MTYRPPKGNRVNFELPTQTPPGSSPSSPVSITLQPFGLDLIGPQLSGYLAGKYPGGITKLEGVPSPALVRILYRGHGLDDYDDGTLLLEVNSDQSGAWRVDGLNPALRYDVICRREGYNDLILSNISPAVE